MSNIVGLRGGPLKDGFGFVLAGVGLLTGVFGQQVLAIIGWLACYGGLVMISTSYRVQNEPWLIHLWRKSRRSKLILTLSLLAVPIGILWTARPRPYKIEAQLCNALKTANDGRSDGIWQVALILSPVNKGSELVFAKDWGSNVTLGGKDNDEVSEKDLERTISLAKDSRGGILVRRITFSPLLPFGKDVTGRFHFQLGLDHDRKGKYVEKMIVRGRWTLRTGVDGYYFEIDTDTDSDPRVVSMDCEMKMRNRFDQS